MPLPRPRQHRAQPRHLVLVDRAVAIAVGAIEQAGARQAQLVLADGAVLVQVGIGDKPAGQRIERLRLSCPREILDGQAAVAVLVEFGEARGCGRRYTRAA